MGRLRSYTRKALKPLVMTLVAMGVAASLVITTPSNAKAFVLPLFPPVLVGATGMALPEVLGAVAITGPIGWTIGGLAAVGAGLYFTKDYWLPYVTGNYGAPGTANGTYDPNQPSPTPTTSPAPDQGSSYTTNSGWTDAAALNTGSNIHYARIGITASTRLNGFDAKINYTGTGYSSGSQLTVVYAIHCKRPDNTTYTETNYVTKFFGNGTNSSYPRQVTLSGFCQQSTHTATGIIAGPLDGATELHKPSGASWNTYPGPINVQSWGDWKATTSTQSPAFDPKSADTKYTTTVECIRADSSRFSLSATSTGADGALKVPSCAAADPGAHGTGKTDVTGLAPGYTVPQPLWSMPAPAPAPDKPLCDTQRPGSPCKLAVKLDGKECVVGVWECENWNDLSRDPNQAPRYSCQYGPYSVPLNTCNPLERAYQPGGAPATDANTDGNPGTAANTDPNGNQINPNTSTGTGTTTGTVPGSAGSPEAGSEGAQCFPSGWAMLNPVEWVLKPVGCALQSAFVPKTQTVQVRADRIKEKINNVGFGPVTTAWVDTFNQVGGGSGCAGPTVSFNFGGVNQSLQPFNACSQPMATVAGITYAFSCILIVLAGGLGVARAIASGFGFNFSLGKGSST